MPFINLAPDNEDSAGALPDSLLALWQKLALTTDQVDPVCCGPAWNLTCHSVFNPYSRIFYLQSMENLLLLCEIPAAGHGMYLMPLDSGWMFGQPLLGFYSYELLEEALEIFSRAYERPLPPVFLSGVRADGPEALNLFSTFSTDFNFYRHKSIVQCSASLSGGIDGWLARRSANHRAKLRKASRRAMEAGIVFTRHRPEHIDDGLALYKKMIEIEKRSWKGIGHCGMAESPSLEFYAALMEQYVRSRMAFVIFAMRGEEYLGFVFGGGVGGIYRGQQFSYIEEARQLSIGNLLQFEQIKWLCELGFQRYDMGPLSGPRMEYKRHWTELARGAQTWMMEIK